MSFGVWRSSTTFTVCLKPAAVSSRHWCVFHVWGGSQSPSSCHGGLKLFFMLFKMFDHLIHTDILSYKSWWGFIAGTLNEMTGWRLNHLWGPQLNSFQVDIDASVAPLSNLRSIRCRCEAEWHLDDRASPDWLLGFTANTVCHLGSFLTCQIWP